MENKVVYESEFYINPYELKDINQFEQTRLTEILDKIDNIEIKEQIKRNILYR